MLLGVFLGVVVHVGKFPRCERLTYLSDKTVVFHVVGNVNGCAFLCQLEKPLFLEKNQRFLRKKNTVFWLAQERTSVHISSHTKNHCFSERCVSRSHRGKYLTYTTTPRNTPRSKKILLEALKEDALRVFLKVFSCTL